MGTTSDELCVFADITGAAFLAVHTLKSYDLLSHSG